jgi:hypothetical protein
MGTRIAKMEISSNSQEFFPRNVLLFKDVLDQWVLILGGGLAAPEGGGGGAWGHEQKKIIFNINLEGNNLSELYLTISFRQNS